MQEAAVTTATVAEENALARMPNMRDLHEACALVMPGKLFRCAAPIEASAKDIEFLLNDLGIVEMIDLRAEEEQGTDPRTLLFKDVPLVRYVRPSWSGKMSKEVVSGSWTEPGRVRHHISLLDRRRYVTGMLRKLPFTSSVPALLTGLYDGPRSMGMLLGEVNRGGLELLYEVLLETSKAEFVAALRVVREAAEKGRPLVFFCKAGKDRTGLLAMLVLASCGVEEGAIIEDYYRSDSYHKMALAGLEDRPELAKLDRATFEKAPRETMATTLRYLHSLYGGPAAYMHTIGFTFGEQRALRAALLGPDSSSSSSSSKL